MAQKSHLVSDKVDQIIDRLNSEWGLLLPKVNRQDAIHAEDPLQLAWKCSGKIRFLSFRLVNLDRVLVEFEERARRVRPAYKQQRERGNLPLYPVQKSLVDRDLDNAKPRNNNVWVTDQKRAELVKLLHDILEREYRQVRKSAPSAYASGSTQQSPVTPQKSVSVSYPNIPTTPMTPSRRPVRFADYGKPDEEMSPLFRSPSKRTMSDPEAKPERKRRQAHIRDYFTRHSADEISPLPRTASHTAQSEQTSFNSDSTEVSSIFSAGKSLYTQSNDSSTFQGSNRKKETLDPKLDPFTNNNTDDSFTLLESTQELLELEKSFTSDEQASINLDPLDLYKHTPFQKKAILPSDVPFWQTWELHRISPLLKVTPLSLNNMIRERCQAEKLTAENFWHTLTQIFRESGISTMPQRSDIQSWTSELNSYENARLQKSVSFSAKLDWNEIPVSGLFKLQLNALGVDRSCRLHRKFGADRFLVVSVPAFDRSNVPSHIRRYDKPADSLYSRVVNWLALETHFIAGRYWRVFYIEDEKSKTKKTSEGQRLKVHMVAETGYDIDKNMVTNLQAVRTRTNGHHHGFLLKDLLVWHMPIEDNLKSSDLKLFSRMGLALSKTTSTVTLDPCEFIYAPDKHANLGDQCCHVGKCSCPVMNDGCSLISYEYAKVVWTAYGGAGPVPSAVQGRISGAKGLWMVDYSNKYPTVSERKYWIEITPSQLKIQPHPRDRILADESQRTFEVVKWASQCKEGHLNIQLISILEDRGVPWEAFERLLSTELKSFCDSLTEAMTKPNLLASWQQEHFGGRKSSIIQYLGRLPYSKEERILRLLCAGFQAYSCPVILDALKDQLKFHLSAYADKMWIKTPCSTTAFCIADPLDILDEGEVFLGFSSLVYNPRNGASDMVLDNMDVLVARNPAYAASDMQKVRAVYKHELRHYRDVVVFSTKGDRPLASYLSGGDYDGDTVTVIWDPTLVDPFRNAALVELPSAQMCGLSQRSKSLGTIFTSPDLLDTEINEFMRGCVHFNCTTTSLGVCSTEFEKLLYSLSQHSGRVKPEDKLSHPGLVKLTALAGYLVDAVKQGYYLQEGDWFDIRRSACGPHKLSIPAFKVVGDTKPPRTAGGACCNIIDHLKFDVAMKQGEHAIAEFHRKFPEGTYYDETLSRPWRQACPVNDPDTPRQRVKQGGLEDHRKPAAHNKNQDVKLEPKTEARPIPASQDILEDLKTQISKVVDLWSSLGKKPNNGPTLSVPAQDKAFVNRVKCTSEAFNAIQPLKVPHSIRADWESNKEMAFNNWVLLRASCLYFHYHSYRSLCWFVAGEELCQIKAQNMQMARTIVPDIYGIFKINTKLVQRETQGASGLQNDEDGFDSAEIEGECVELLGAEDDTGT